MRYFLVALTLLSVSPAWGQTTTYRDRNGNRGDSVSREGDREVVRDLNGNRLGYSEQQGSQTVYRDKNGNRIGSSTNTH